MLENARMSKVLWRALLAFLGAALLGSVWAGFFAGGCGNCGGTAGSGSGRVLAQSGVLCYVALLGTALLRGRSRLLWRGVLLAASVHASLLVLLFTRREFCPPCLWTGAFAIAAAGVSCLIEPLNLARASVILPVAAVATEVSLLALGLFATAEGRGLPPGSQARPGVVEMVVYERVDCVYCQRLEAEVLPALSREFGPRLAIERRSAEAIPGLPTPTLLLSGVGGRRSYPGLPSPEVLRDAVLDCLGGPHDRQAMLPASR